MADSFWRIKNKNTKALEFLLILKNMAFFPTKANDRLPGSLTAGPIMAARSWSTQPGVSFGVPPEQTKHVAPEKAKKGFLTQDKELETTSK